MSGRRTLAGDRRRRKLITVLWMAGFSLVIIFLIYKELTAILYILATVGVTALLLVVATSDLAHAETLPTATQPPGDAANVANKTTR